MAEVAKNSQKFAESRSEIHSAWGSRHSLGVRKWAQFLQHRAKEWQELQVSERDGRLLSKGVPHL